MHCKECGKSFPSRYLSRHQCIRDLKEHGTSSKENDTEWNEIDLEQGRNNNFMNIDIKNRIETTGNQVEINDGEDDENELCDEEVSDEVFYKLFEEAFFSMRRSHQRVKMTIKGPN